MLFAWIGVGPMEMAIVAIVLVLLFGNRFPSIMRSLGSSLVEFKKGAKGLEDTAAEVNGTFRDVSQSVTKKL